MTGKVSYPVLNKQSIKSQDHWIAETQEKEPREGSEVIFKETFIFLRKP